MTASPPLGDRRPAARRFASHAVLACASALLALHAGAAPLAYVSSEKDDAIAVVDMAGKAVTGRIATCKRPRHLQLTPDRRQLIAACGDSHAADVIDLATQRSVRRLPLGDDPEAFDLSPDGRTLYVSNEDEGALGFIDFASGKLLRSVPVGKEPEGVKVSPDGKTVFVASEVANMVHAIDTGSGKLLKNIKVGKRPRRLAFTPDGAELWVSNELDASVSIVSLRELAVVHTLRFELKGVRAADITPVGLVLSRDGKRAFVALGRANHVAFVDVPTRKVSAMVLAGKRAWGLALNAAETELLVVNGLSDDLSFIDVAAAKAVKTVPVGRVPYMAVIAE